MRRLFNVLARRVETRALLLWLAAAASIWGFLSIAGEVSEGETTGLDRELLMLLRNPGDPSDPIGPRWFEEAMRDVTALGGFTVLTFFTVAAVLAFAFHGKVRQAATLAVTVILAQTSSDILKEIYERPRPGLVSHGSYVYSASFPSGHSTQAAATFLILATMIASLEPRRATKAMVYAVAAICIVMVGFSRVYLGVHWPSDVLAGWSLGAAWAFVGWVAFNRLRPRESESAVN